MQRYLSTPAGLLVPDTITDAPRTSSLYGGGGGFGYGGAPGNYSAGMQSDGRGYVYFPDLAAKRDLRPQARIEITRKARWLTRNTGIGGRFRDGIADLVGFLTPQPSTKDQDWNEEILHLFLEVMGNPLTFDAAGEENFFDRQLTLTRLSLQDGDCGLALALDDAGNPVTQLYQGPQISNPYGGDLRDGWWDGVRTDSNQRIEEISLLNDDLSEQAFVMDASEFLLYGRREPGAVRGTSIFCRFADRMLDVREIDNDEMRGIKASNLVGIVITNGVLQNQQNAAVLQKMIAASAMGEEVKGNVKKEIDLEQITRGGGAIAELGLGQSMDVIHDDRRNPNRASLIDYFIRDMAWASKYPPEVLWFIGQLNGPSVRFTIKQAERANECYRHPLEWKFCKRIWAWFTAQMQQQGRIRWCKDRNFTACDWRRSSSMTVDAGRDISNGLAEIAAGGNTLEAWYGEANQDYRQQLRQIAVEKQLAMKLEEEFKLPPGSILGNASIVFAPNGQPSNQPSAK